VTKGKRVYFAKLTSFSNDILQSTLENYRLPLSLPGVSEVNRFVAREEELSQLRRILVSKPGRQTAVVHGLGGIGKTQLVIAYCKRHRTEYSTTIWLNARDETSLKQSFTQVAERILRYDSSMTYIALAVESRDAGKIVEAVKRWLDESANNSWLLIYDNYDHPAINTSSQARKEASFTVEHEPNADKKCQTEQTDTKAFDLRLYLPQTDHGAVIITSRSSVKLGQPLKIGKLLDEQDNLDILASTSGRGNIEKGKS
jgi:hypothetical protein